MEWPCPHQPPSNLHTKTTLQPLDGHEGIPHSEHSLNVIDRGEIALLKVAKQNLGTSLERMLSYASLRALLQAPLEPQISMSSSFGSLQVQIISPSTSTQSIKLSPMHLL
uniref:Uncharacterized protein n=1 Tax=Aegilops tauschii subsp. strangulata TaxID=200361 RepID=A0A453R4T7_AEGTS